MKDGVRLSIPNVNDPIGEKTIVDLPPYTLALYIKTEAPNGWPIRYSVRVTNDGDLEVRCDGGQGKIVITELTGNGVTLGVETNK